MKLRKVVGEALLKEGCDILFVAAGAAGNGTFTAVKESGGNYVIGCDVDQLMTVSLATGTLSSHLC